MVIVIFKFSNVKTKPTPPPAPFIKPVIDEYGMIIDLYGTYTINSK